MAGRRAWGWVLSICLAGWGLAYSSASRKSVTVDEFQALPHGLVIWYTGRMDIDPGAPPLSKILAALPLLHNTPAPSAAELPIGGSSWLLGYPFAEQHASEYHALYMRSRLIPLAAYLITAVLTGLLARRLYGNTAFVFAVAFTVLCPNMLAHGRLVTPDIFLAAAVAAVLLAADSLICRPRAGQAIGLGVALGAACLFKFTGILLFVLLPAAVATVQLVMRRRAESAEQPEFRRVWVGLLAAAAVAIFVINLGYGFQGSGTSVGHFSFQSGLLRAIGGVLPTWLPVPFPYWFVAGFDVQMAEQGYVAYVLGRFNTTGFWYYYIVAFLVKTPVPVLVLTVLATCSRTRIETREIPALVVFIGAFLIVSLTGHKNIGIRYLLFLFPIIALWLARLAEAGAAQRFEQRKRLLLLGAAGAWLLVADLMIWPDYLSAFNLISGGPDKGHFYLLDSNLDWGQDLIQLRRYMRKHSIDSVDLAYAGRVRPEIYGINYRMLGVGDAQRYVVISANLLWGRMYFVNGTAYWPPDPETYAPLRTLDPVAVIGHTLYVFDFGAEDQREDQCTVEGGKAGETVRHPK